MEIRETVCQESALKVEQGVIRGAKLLGLNSRNGRRYESKALKAALALYEGKKVYVDHPDDNAKERKFEDWAGVIENVKFRKDGLYGDVVLREQCDHFKGIIEAASNPKFSKSCGFSHVAEGESHFDGETEIIESIKQVFSVDLVTDPATTAGLFESRKNNSFREVVEALPDEHEAIRTRLIEMMDAGYMDGGFSMGNPKGDQPTDQLSQIAAMLQTLVTALADVSKAAVKANQPKVVAPPPSGDAPGESAPGEEEGGEGTEDEDMTEEDKKKVDAFESLTRENAELKASKQLIESGRQATPARMKALANCVTDDERAELLESWPKIEAGGRPGSSPPLIESDSDFPTNNPEKFAALLR